MFWGGWWSPQQQLFPPNHRWASPYSCHDWLPLQKIIDRFKRVEGDMENSNIVICVLLTSIDSAPLADSAHSPPWGVGVWGGGGDQVIVHITVEACLFSWGFLL